MTEDSARTGDRDWWTRPRVVLPIAGALMLFVALLTPQTSAGRFGDARLSSRLSGTMGAKVLKETARRLGWRTTERLEPDLPRLTDGTTIHAVLAPRLPVSGTEAHAYLEAVRAGDGLLLAIDGRTPLTDSLGVSHLPRGGTFRSEAVTSQCRARREVAPALWPDGQAHLFGVRWLRGTPAGVVTFGRLSFSGLGDLDPGDAAAGFPYGAGRVVVVADPDLLRNDALRYCRWDLDLLAVQLLEYLRAGGVQPRATLAFDEYHQGFGAHPSMSDATLTFLVTHPVGRTILQLAVAGLILLLALAPRALPPRDEPIVERRDPLEQVDALSHAYEQVAATRTATARLLRGLRRRVHRGASGSRARPDVDFLRELATRAPSLASEVALVERALATPISTRDLPEVGAALDRIELSLSTRPT